MVGLGRAVGETMIVLMATGNTPVMSWNVFDGFRTLSANIAVELPEAVKNSTHYRTLFLAALCLFAMTFVLNTVAEVVRAVWTTGDETELHQVAADQMLTLPSPQAGVSKRVIAPGESVTAEIAATDLPPGATARWSVNGSVFENPATITFAPAAKQRAGELLTMNTDGSARFWKQWSSAVNARTRTGQSGTAQRRQGTKDVAEQA